MIYCVRKQVRRDYNLRKRAKLHNAVCCDKLGDISVGSFQANIDTLARVYPGFFFFLINILVRLHPAKYRSKIINLFIFFFIACLKQEPLNTFTDSCKSNAIAFISRIKILFDTFVDF